jgi:hypothetical protein
MCKQDGRLAIASRLTYRKSDWTCEPPSVIPSTSRLTISGGRRIMSWLVKNSDEGQRRPPMFQQGKQHHSVISLVLFISSQYYLNLPCFLQAWRGAISQTQIFPDFKTLSACSRRRSGCGGRSPTWK